MMGLVPLVLEFAAFVSTIYYITYFCYHYFLILTVSLSCGGTVAENSSYIGVFHVL